MVIEVYHIPQPYITPEYKSYLRSFQGYIAKFEGHLYEIELKYQTLRDVFRDIFRYFDVFLSSYEGGFKSLERKRV